MRHRRLYVAKYYFRLWEYETTEQLKAEHGPVFGCCSLLKRPKVCVGDIYVALDQPSSIAIHELYHAARHFGRTMRRTVPFQYDGEARPAGQEEYEALVIERLWEQVLRGAPRERLP